VIESVNVEVAPPTVDAASRSPFVFEPTSYQEPAESGTREEQPEPTLTAVSPGLAPESCSATERPADRVEQIIADAELAAINGDIPAAVTALRECARSHADLIEPVAKLAEVAATHGLDDTLADAEARLCDLYCRRGDYVAARTVAEALVRRHPGETRHRARLMFVENELAEQSATSAEPASDEIAAAEVGPDEAEDMAFRRALDVLLTCEDAFADEAALTDARAALERAADVPRHRVAACRQLARLDADAGRWMSALAWLENAAVGIELPADEEDLAYEMALVLERAGERDRALGVFTEIATKTGPDYRDISARIVQLSSTGVSRDEHLLAS
jgi:tetratricopeptide (TPR) repeat protein